MDLELQESLSDNWDFTSESDTETVLAAYDKYGEDCVDHLRGMFSFAVWDDQKQRLFCCEGSLWDQALLLCGC